jgi:hypothetical protein
MMQKELDAAVTIFVNYLTNYHVARCILIIGSTDTKGVFVHVVRIVVTCHIYTKL